MISVVSLVSGAELVAVRRSRAPADVGHRIASASDSLVLALPLRSLEGATRDSGAW